MLKDQIAIKKAVIKKVIEVVFLGFLMSGKTPKKIQIKQIKKYKINDMFL